MNRGSRIQAKEMKKVLNVKIKELNKIRASSQKVKRRNDYIETVI
jgi:hypothetical protein